MQSQMAAQEFALKEQIDMSRAEAENQLDIVRAAEIEAKIDNLNSETDRVDLEVALGETVANENIKVSI